MPEISGSPRIGDAPNNVRYLGQSGGYMLTESFTARDPKPTLGQSPDHPRLGLESGGVDLTRPSRFLDRN